MKKQNKKNTRKKKFNQCQVCGEEFPKESKIKLCTYHLVQSRRIQRLNIERLMHV